ncbi:DUF1828 domain-containing protein [Desulforhabdus sp. TSK]|uniref:DUF1828 domain-containing protein n=1 Tax=Desulforhabdus sp. TSK TaxID=2925014 RepID=UPI001FC7E1C9|nr:DUF1828 domain-containing protein [Desulforhabdus sp. TSK]GKT08571.1 hypothetical protein DSTSK_18760 [Desulforhabdus sp. TSK]
MADYRSPSGLLQAIARCRAILFDDHDPEEAAESRKSMVAPAQRSAAGIPTGSVAMNSICEEIMNGYRRLLICSELDGHVQVRTPYLYPDGDFIDVYIQRVGDQTIVTDLGETIRWLGTQALSTKKSHKQLAIIGDICSNHEVLFYRGMIMRGEKLTGRSGRVYTIDFHTFSLQKTALICTLSTGGKASAKRLAEHVVTTWHDLSYSKVGREAQSFISLFDDTIDVWSSEDFNLLETLSDIAYWSKPDDFTDQLLAA